MVRAVLFMYVGFFEREAVTCSVHYRGSTRSRIDIPKLCL